jgi:hypothetical protein
MENNKQQTALSFFLMGLIDLEIGKGIATDKVKELHYLFDQAKEMEKQQITDFANDYADAVMGGCVKRAEQYYEQKYGGNK